jgi:hypothetical protein
MHGLLFAVLLCGSGCASHFRSLPTRQEFSKPLPELQQQYTAVYRYEPSFGRFMFTPIWDMPYADDLVKKWGEPDEKSLSWWNLYTLFIFHPMSRWYWHMGDKTVDVLIDSPLGYGYEPHVFTLKVVEKEGQK